MILHVFQDGSGADATVTAGGQTRVTALDGTASSWTLIGSFPVGGSSEAKQLLWVGRAVGGTIIVAGGNAAGDDVYWRIYEFTDDNTGTTVAQLIENVTAGATVNSTGTSAAIADASVSVTGENRLCLNFVGVNDDNAVSDFAGQIGGTWVEAVAEYADATGTDACIQLQRAAVAASIDFLTGSGAGVSFGNSPRDEAAQSFTPDGDSTVANVQLVLATEFSPADDVIVEIQTDTAGAPSGTVLGTARISSSSLASTFAAYSFAISASLTAGTTYWIVVSRSGALDSNDFLWQQAAVSYGSGQPATLNGAVWSVGGTDFAFKVTYSLAKIDGGTFTMAASDAWGTVGFALVPQPPAAKSLVPPPRRQLATVYRM